MLPLPASPHALLPALAAEELRRRPRATPVRIPTRTVAPPRECLTTCGDLLHRSPEGTHR